MTQVLPGEAEQKEIVRRCWYSHDGHWFQSAAAELGMEMANQLNRRALRAQGASEARRLRKALGMREICGLDDFLRLFDALASVLVPPPTAVRLERPGDRSYAIHVDRCFVHESVVRAGNPESYQCAVFDRIAGWHDGAGLPLASEPPGLRCAKAMGGVCHRTLQLR
ncbi:MAG: DUF6125 family protein [Deltaproteobacteria bacterium]|nr:DUF6125 family protein [Deltaproteobacteria bacterium]